MRKFLLAALLAISTFVAANTPMGHLKYLYLDGKNPQGVATVAKGKNILVAGDSFCNDSNELAEAIDAAITADNVYKTCVAGAQLSAILTQASAFMANRSNWTGNAKPDVLIIQGGVNDANTGNSAATMTGRIASLIAFARNNSMIPVILTPPPYKAYTGWAAGEQTEYDSYMTTLLARSDVVVVDTYTTLEGVADTINASYDGGDGLHPNATGYAAMATAIAPAITLLQNKVNN